MSIAGNITTDDLKNSFYQQGNIYISKLAKQKFEAFEKAYLEVRQKEKRVLSIDEIKALPFVSKSHHDFKIWKTRRNNINRFLNYLSNKKQTLKILDLGCGNGFFTNLMSVQGHQVIGADVNLHELMQAEEAFASSNIKWYYIDIMSEKIPNTKFDIITFCCSFQYFKDPIAVINRCMNLLSEDGEIHIIDSPFYKVSEQKAAETRSILYYQSLGVSEMKQHYYHHSLEIFTNFKFTLCYKPTRVLKWLSGMRYSPFYWIKIKH